MQTHLLDRGVDSATVSKGTDAYQVEGEVVQWYYHQGASAKPFIELKLNVRDVHSNRIVRTDILKGDGARRQSLSMLADQLMEEYVNALPLSVYTEQKTDPEVDKPELPYLEALGPTGNTPVALGMRTSARSASAFQMDTVVPVSKPLAGRSVAFYYGANPPVDELSQFDRLVLEPDNINSVELVQLNSQGAQSYAYLSVGEVGKARAYASQIKSEWVLGNNTVWDSKVLDLANPDLRGFLLKRVADLVEQGYHGLFLDTMDSFNLVAKSPEQRQRQTAGLVSLIESFSNRYPRLKIMTNRGFEVLDDIAGHVDAVVAESLYSAWNNDAQRYQAVDENDRQWLLSKLNHVTDTLGLEVIVLDYVAPSERDSARAVASRIARHGFIPWVANPELDYLGVGALEVVPRKVLLLYNGSEEGAMKDSDVHRNVAMPLEYLGYVPHYLDVSAQALPAGVLKGRYAGIVTWAKDPFGIGEFRPWLHRQMQDSVPVAFFAQLPVSVDGKLTSLMGIKSGKALQASTATVSYTDEMIQPELSLSARVDPFEHALENQRDTSTVHMRYSDKQGATADVVVTGEFGGFALTPGDMQPGIDYSTSWVVDPFRFLETALQLPRVPQPDVTTEAGRRLWLAHIDGDALPSWAEMPGRRLGAEVLYKEVLTRYPLPHTVSVVEGEMTGFPAYADRTARMFDIARRTFRLENVEIASHTYSHPFFWSALDRGGASGRYNLPINGYQYSAEREIAGSIDFINHSLAPPDKKNKVMLWSGDALPREHELAITSRLGMANMNGGFTAITSRAPSVTLVSPMARPVGKYLQVYAPVMNENVYTADWRGPFDGFRDVIETFKMTESPRRLKPINVYYHFYSGTKVAALRALKEVYDWSTAQDIFPLFVSDFAPKVANFRQAGVARYLDGRWKLTRLGNIRSIRVLGEPVFPKLVGSQGVSGARQLHDGVYVHTDGREEVTFMSSDTIGTLPHLISSNGKVRHWNASANALDFRITAEVPVSVELGGSLSASCVLDTGDGVVRAKSLPGNVLRFAFTTKDTGHVILNCPS